MYKRIFLMMIIVLSVGTLLGYGREVLAMRPHPDISLQAFTNGEGVNFSVVTETLKLLPPDGAALPNGHYGRSVLIDADMLFVGQAPVGNYPHPGFNPGELFIYDRHAGGPNSWGLIRVITPSDSISGNGDSFGTALALSGDTLLVGAATGDGNSNETGTAYIFERNVGGPGNWGQVAKLQASDGAFQDRFGWTVDIDGDTAVVGARWDDNSNGFEAGAIYIFERNAGGPNNWGQVRKVIASDGSSVDRYGVAVAISGDIIVVGTDGQDNNGFESGSVYILDRNLGGANNWGEVAQIYPNQPGANHQFGISVDIEGTVLAVGAFQSAPNAGAVYLFDRNAGGANNWGQTAHLVPSDGLGGDRFGIAVQLEGGRLIVGAQFGDGVSINSGAAYLFERDAVNPNQWLEIDKLMASDGATNDQFGWGVAVSGETMAVGAFFSDHFCPTNPDCDSGSVYLYSPDLLADVTIEKVVSDVTAVPGQPITYTLAFTNNGPDSAFNTIITDVIPTTIANPTFTSSGVAITPTGSVPFVWQVAEMTPGMGGVITVTGIISPELLSETTIVNTAVITNSADITPTNNSSTTVTQVIIPQINLSASDYVVNEDGGQVVVTAVLSPAQPFLDVTVGYETGDGTALAGEDYTAVSGILTFTAGMTEAQILVPILDDQLVEPDETFSLELSDPAHATLGSIVTTTITILDDDTYPELNLSAADYTVFENGGQVVLTVTLSHPYPESVSVAYETADGTAMAGEDYTAVSGILTFTAGMTEVQILVPILDDQLVEPDETFSLELSDPAHATLGSIVNATITILDDDAYPELNLSAADYTVFENDVQVTLTITLSHPYPAAVSVVYETADGTAVAGEDYTAVSGILTFTAGMTQANILVPILDDQLVESDETFTLELSDPIYGVLGNMVSATITIWDDDTYPELNLSTSEYSVLEDAGQVVLTATLSAPYPGTVTVAYETTDGTAIAGEDYTAVTGTLTFTTGITQANILVPILDDQLVEGSETFTVTLSNPVHGTLGSLVEATVLIIDDDSIPLVSLSSEQYVVSENVGEAVFTVTLSHVYPEPVSLVYETADGTAVAGEDYGPVTGTLTISPGETLATFTSPIIDDALVEPAETFSISLTGFINALPQPPVTAVVTILDNDEEPPVSSATIYLPLIMRSAPPAPPVEFRVHIGDAIPNRPVVAQGETFYTTVVQIPATLPEGGQFYLSTVPDQVTATAVDDQISFSLANGDTVFTYRYSDHGEPIQPHIVPVPRSLIAAMAGQSVTVRYTDVFGQFVSATTVWLIWTP